MIELLKNFLAENNITLEKWEINGNIINFRISIKVDINNVGNVCINGKVRNTYSSKYLLECSLKDGEIIINGMDASMVNSEWKIFLRKEKLKLLDNV